MLRAVWFGGLVMRAVWYGDEGCLVWFGNEGRWFGVGQFALVMRAV